jgi:hypothetical protein
MDKYYESINKNKNMKQEIKTTTKRVDNADGSYEETRVEEVIGGFIKTFCKYYKEDDCWEREEEKSVHMENPFEEKSIVDKLSEILNNRY